MKRLNKKGFTLVELLAVIVVLALLMVVAASSIGSALDNSKKSALNSEAKKLLTNITAEAKSLDLTNSLNDTNLEKIYNGIDGDFAYDVVVNSSDGTVVALRVCYDDYSITAAGSPLSIPTSVDSTKADCTTTGSGDAAKVTGSVTVKTPACADYLESTSCGKNSSCKWSDEGKCVDNS